MDYNLNKDLAGGKIDEILKTTIGTHYMIASAVILLLVVVVLWMAWSKEGFMPTALMRYQQDDNALVANKEHMDAAPVDRSKSWFAQAVQNTAGGSFTIDPSAAPGQPGSLSYQVLNSPQFACDTRVAAPTDAWQWMQGVATSEGFEAIKNDNQLSALLAGN